MQRRTERRQAQLATQPEPETPTLEGLGRWQRDYLLALQYGTSEHNATSVARVSQAIVNDECAHNPRFVSARDAIMMGRALGTVEDMRESARAKLGHMIQVVAERALSPDTAVRDTIAGTRLMSDMGGVTGQGTQVTINNQVNAVTSWLGVDAPPRRQGG